VLNLLLPLFFVTTCNYKVLRELLFLRNLKEGQNCLQIYYLCISIVMLCYLVVAEPPVVINFSCIKTEPFRQTVLLMDRNIEWQKEKSRLISWPW